MLSLRALSVCLLLLVAVPTAVLAGLGLRSTDGLEERLQQRLEDEVREARRHLEGEALRLVEQQQREASAKAQAVADALARALPTQTGGPLWALTNGELARLQAAPSLGRLWDVRVLDPQGRGLLPREHDPDGAMDESEAARLIADLRRDAERALYGPGGRAEALAVWTRAEDALTRAGLRDALTAERAWTWVQSGEPGGAKVVTHLSRSDHIARTPSARTWVLVLLHEAAEERVRVRRALSMLEQDGVLDEVPLTAQERAAVRAVLLPHYANRTGRDLRRWRASLPAGLTLELECDVGPLADERLDDLVGGRGALQAPAHVALTPLGGAPPAGRTPADQVVGLPLGAGAVRWVRLEHAQATTLRAEVASRRRWTVVGVISLAAVVALGLTLLRRALTREREAVRLRDDFLANVSHELRTPLTSVCLHADLLAEERVSDAQRRAHAGVVRAEGARLATLVEDLLDVGALERGARRLEPEPVDLGAAVERAVAPLRVLAEQAGRGLSCDVAAAGASLADPHALARILSNLLRNALDHGTPARDGGRGRIQVRAASGPEGSWVEVEDDGPGIPPADRLRLFERFRRGSTAKGTRGTGLGLALSRALARAMGGDLVLRDDDTRTVFRLTLPPVPADGVEGQEVGSPA